jgi:hypothetical protein
VPERPRYLLPVLQGVLLLRFCCAFIALLQEVAGGFSAGVVKRPKSAEDREEWGHKTGFGAGMRVSTTEAIHEYPPSPNRVGVNFGPEGQGPTRRWPRYTGNRWPRAVRDLWYTQRSTVFPGRTTVGIAAVYRKYTGGTPIQAVLANNESPFYPHCCASQTIRPPDRRVAARAFLQKTPFLVYPRSTLLGDSRPSAVTFSVGEVERPKSAETREKLGPKGGFGTRMEAGTREAVHRDQGGQTRPVPTRAHCGYSEED